MNNTPLGIQIPLSIKTVSPLHIGGNDVLSPLADYWIDDQKIIHLVNGQLLASKVYDSGKTDEYIRMVEQVATEKKGKMLPDFVRHSLGKQLAELGKKTTFKSYGIENPIEIDTCIQTDGLPYLPGSSIKGALRSAILLNWLNSGKPESDKALDDFLEALRSFSQRSDWKKGQKINEIEKAFHERMEEKLFGKLKDDNRLATSCLRVKDSNAIDEGHIVVYQLERFNLLTGERNIPVLKQCIAKNACLNTTAYIDYYSCHDKTHHPIFRNIGNKTELFALLNALSLELLKYELNLFQNKEVYSLKLNQYKDFMEAIKEKIEQSGNRKAWMRMGFGKMQFYQTIALGIFRKLGQDEENPDWIQYLCYCNKMSDDLAPVYPSTRVLTSAAQEPLGWIELE